MHQHQLKSIFSAHSERSFPYFIIVAQVTVDFGVFLRNFKSSFEQGHITFPETNENGMKRAIELK